MTQISQKLKIPDKRIWRVVAYHVHEALNRVDLSAVKFVGIDETSRKKGHKYISTIADLLSGKIIFICKGKDSTVLKSFSDFFTKHAGKKDNIDLVCCDMSPAFIKGICDQLPGVNGGMKVYKCGGIELYTSIHNSIEIYPGRL